jgi:hypothetical protein
MQCGENAPRALIEIELRYIVDIQRMEMNR